MKTFKMITFLAGLLFISLSCGGGGESGTNDSGVKEKYNDLKKERLIGNVKSVRQRVYWALEKFGRFDKGKLQNMTAHDFLKVFNEAGFLIEEVHYNAQDQIVSRKLLTYNDENQLIKEEFHLDGKLNSTTNYTYESGVLKGKETLDDKGKLKERYAYTYYDTGLLMDEDLYNAGNTLSRKIVHIYEGKTLAKKDYYWGGGSPFKREFFTYEQNNIESILTEKYQNREPLFDSRVEFLDYNFLDDYLRKIVYDKDNREIEINTYDYDDFGNLLSFSVKKLVETVVEHSVSEGIETVSLDDEIENTIAIESDGVVKETYSDWKPGIGASYEYFYDNQNNWTTKITYKIDEKGEKVRQFYYERVVEYR